MKIFKILIVSQIGKTFNQTNEDEILSCLKTIGFNLFEKEIVRVQIPIKENGNISKQKDQTIRNRVRNENFDFVALWKISKKQIWGERSPKVLIKEFPR